MIHKTIHITSNEYCFQAYVLFSTKWNIEHRVFPAKQKKLCKRSFMNKIVMASYPIKIQCLWGKIILCDMCNQITTRCKQTCRYMTHIK